MAEFRFVRGDRYALTCPLTKDGVVFNLTSGGPWTTTATLAQGDTAKAITEAENALKTTLTVQNTTTGCTVTICASALLSEGLYSLEVRTTDGTLSYTWPSWSIRIVEPTRI
jgi:enoyl-[acyl-carrier-protein] reductase (NADH)